MDSLKTVEENELKRLGHSFVKRCLGSDKIACLH